MRETIYCHGELQEVFQCWNWYEGKWMWKCSCCGTWIPWYVY